MYTFYRWLSNYVLRNPRALRKPSKRFADTSEFELKYRVQILLLVTKLYIYICIYIFNITWVVPFENNNQNFTALLHL